MLLFTSISQWPVIFNSPIISYRDIIHLFSRFVVVCGDGEYIIYTALAWRNKSFGAAEEFVWAADSSMYCIREGNSKVKVFKNFKEVFDFKPDYGVDGIYGGHLLGVRSASGLTFYNWDTTNLVRRIEVTPKQVTRISLLNIAF